ncbi:MAG: hypothetical protein EpisKO_10040 [Epibacterium sp.]
MGGLRMLFVGLLTFACALALSMGASLAQSQEIVRVPWTEAPPMMMSDAEGQPSGFTVELAQMLAQEAGFDIEFRHYDRIDEVTAAQARGETDMLAGVDLIDVFQPQNRISDPIARITVSLAVPTERADEFDPANLDGKRVAVIPPILGSDPDLLPGAALVPHANPEAALISVLSGQADAMSYSTNVTFAMLRAARLDGRIAFLDPPLLETTRGVVVHQSRPELLERINAVLPQLEAKGSLQALREKYLLAIPAPVPDTLTVGVHHVPPFVSISEDGTPGGFGVEILESLAERAGLKLRYQRITDAEFGRGPRQGGVDLMPMMASNPTRRARMDFTFPVHRVPFSIFTLHEAAIAPQGLDDLIGLRVGVEDGKNAAQLAEAHGGLTLSYHEGKDGIMNALLQGQVDAVLAPNSAFTSHLERSHLRDKVLISREPFYTSESGPALRLGLGEVREALNAVIPAYLISEDYERLQQEWFGTPTFWTSARLRMLLALGLSFLLFALSFGIWQKMQRSRAQERQARLLQQSRQLEVLVDELERSNRELDSFADIASHDLKEPLRGIQWQVQALQERAAEALPEEICRIEQLCAQMETTISDLLASAQHRGKGSDIADIETGDVVDEIRTELAELLTETKGELRVETPLPRVHASRAKAKVVFQNLIANGLIYNRSDTPVVRVGYLSEDTPDDSGLLHVFYVRDNGIGIETEDQGQIFQPGVRGKHSGMRRLPGTGGNGLGLSFAKEIVESYGQLIAFETTPGEGTTFYFSLPNAKGEEAISVTGEARLADAR